jgi:fused signal recognition particle receptor
MLLHFTTSGRCGSVGIFSKINFGLKKTRDKMSGAIDDLLDSFDALSDDLYTELEEILVMGDVGVTTAVEITQALKERAKKKRLDSPQLIKDEIKNIVAEMLEGGEDMGLITKPSIILVIGVNGVGKTTTIGKMAAMYKAQGKKVILAAADTFRAAAIDQLQVWADRAGVDIVKHKEGADPAAVIFDTIAAGRAREADIIICDTAGRLHNKKNLMDELGKIYKVIDKELPYSDREVLLVLDATTGQNAVNQAREFQSVAELTGIILTKLDGTARGGVVLSIKNELKIPVKFVGVGEKLDDLQPFDPKAFAEGLFESVNENEFPEDYALAEAESYEDDTIFEKAAEEDFEEAGVYDSSEVGEDEPFAAVEEESADLEAADTSGDEGYSQEEESVVEEEKQEDKKRKKGLFGMFSKK